MFFQKTELQKAVKKAMKNNKTCVDDIYAGKGTSKNFLIGQVMRLTSGAYTSKEVEAEINVQLR